MRMFHKPRQKRPPQANSQSPLETAPPNDPLPPAADHPPQQPPASPHSQPRPASAHQRARQRPAAKQTSSLKFTDFEREIRYFFRRKELLEEALTHSSYAYEKRASTRDNELLEFLGDSVIGLITADFFYSSYQDMTEGDLSKLKSSAASTVALAEFAKQIKLDKHIHLGHGEERSGGRKKSTILAGVFESVVGAVYLDGGYEAARGLFLPLLESTFRQVKTAGYTVDNYKSALQEYLQKEDLPSPQYKLQSVSGPDHDRIFIVEVFSSRTPLARAKGASRKAAEQKAAEMALKSFMGKKIKSFTSETFIVEK